MSKAGPKQGNRFVFVTVCRKRRRGDTSIHSVDGFVVHRSSELFKPADRPARRNISQQIRTKLYSQCVYPGRIMAPANPSDSSSAIERPMYSDHATRDQRLAWHADLLGQLANPSRLQVCIFLSDREEDVNSLARKIGISQPALSRHLARLHRSGIIKFRSHAQFRYYSCDHPDVLELLKTLTELYSPDLSQDKMPSLSKTPKAL